MGSDAVAALPQWQFAERLMLECEFVIGVRAGHRHHEVERSIAGWHLAPPCLMVFDCFEPGISSSSIRRALQSNRRADGLLSSVRRYARREWLYVSPSEALSAKSI
jgi:nicotinic acid mononucleotide adenylyltransferase